MSALHRWVQTFRKLHFAFPFLTEVCPSTTTKTWSHLGWIKFHLWFCFQVSSGKRFVFAMAVSSFGLQYTWTLLHDAVYWLLRNILCATLLARLFLFLLAVIDNIFLLWVFLPLFDVTLLTVPPFRLPSTSSGFFQQLSCTVVSFMSFMLCPSYQGLPALCSLLWKHSKQHSSIESGDCLTFTLIFFFNKTRG